MRNEISSWVKVKNAVSKELTTLELKDLFERATNSYLTMNEIIRQDLHAMLDCDDSSDAWKRNFIRVAIPQIECLCHCYRAFLQVGHKLGEKFTPKEEKAILDEKKLSASDRIKYTVRGSYTALKVTPKPDFGNDNWSQAKEAIEKRSKLMHPQSIDDLTITETEWQRMSDGINSIALSKIDPPMLR